MTPLAMLSVLASEIPRAGAWPLALATLAYGAALARREWRRPQIELAFSGDKSPILVDGEPVAEVLLRWRGPLAFLRWRDSNGRRHRLVWWPDTLPAATRRELRLAAPDREAARGRPSMAP
ncbi:hypothetical protein BH23PSE2_BH23PSE2_09740 [soil metagenome]